MVLLLFLYAPRARGFFLGTSPEILTILTVWLSLRSETYLATFGAFILGFIRDGLALNPVGLFSLTLVLAVFLVKGLMRVLDFNHFPFRLVLVLVVYFSVHLVIYPLFMYIYMGSRIFGLMSTQITAYCIQAVVTTLLSPAIFGVFDLVASIGRERE
jgi:cell shape-determining protein MreD